MNIEPADLLTDEQRKLLSERFFQKASKALDKVEFTKSDIQKMKNSMLTYIDETGVITDALECLEFQNLAKALEKKLIEALK